MKSSSFGVLRSDSGMDRFLSSCRHFMYDESWSNEYEKNFDIFCEDKIILFFLMSWATLINNTNSV
jgi:hypothetical protein